MPLLARYLPSHKPFILDFKTNMLVGIFDANEHISFVYYKKNTPAELVFYFILFVFKSFDLFFYLF
jgi:hypothetical protein